MKHFTNKFVEPTASTTRRWWQLGYLHTLESPVVAAAYKQFITVMKCTKKGAWAGVLGITD